MPDDNKGFTFPHIMAQAMVIVEDGQKKGRHTQLQIMQWINKRFYFMWYMGMRHYDPKVAG